MKAQAFIMVNYNPTKKRKMTEVSVLSDNGFERVEIRKDYGGLLYAARIVKTDNDAIIFSKREYLTQKALERDLATSSDFWDFSGN